MRPLSLSLFLVIGVVGLAGCGGSSSPASTPPTNKYTGTLSITGALPSGTTACLATHAVTFLPAGAGADVHTVSAAGGDCLEFVNEDSANHRPSTHGSPSCPALDAPAELSTGESFTTAPLDGTKTCYWQDALNPPPPPSSGNPGY